MFYQSLAEGIWLCFILSHIISSFIDTAIYLAAYMIDRMSYYNLITTTKFMDEHICA